MCINIYTHNGVHLLQPGWDVGAERSKERTAVVFSFRCHIRVWQLTLTEDRGTCVGCFIMLGVAG